MKRFLLTAFLCLSMSLSVLGAEVRVSHRTMSVPCVMDEDGGHTYTFKESDGSFGVINVGSSVNVDIFSPQGKLEEHKNIMITQGKFGGYIYDGENHFFLFGNSNENGSMQTTLYKLLKYNRSFDKVGALSFRGDNIIGKDVFKSESGLCNMKIEGNLLFINDVVQEYRTENNDYTNNRSVIIDKNSFRYLNSVGGMTLEKRGDVRNCVSSVFSAVDDNKYYFAVGSLYGIDLIKMDPLDNEDVGKHRVTNIINTQFTSYYPDMRMTDSIGKGALTLDGFEAGSASFMAIGTESFGDDKKLYVCTIPKSQVGIINARYDYLTEEPGDITDVKVIKLSNDDIMIMWKDAGVIRYTHLDGTGRMSSPMKRIFGSELGNVLPYYAAKDKELTWACMENNDDFSYYVYKN